MSVGYSRKLKGISVRSLKVRLQSEQRNIREPSEVLLLCSLVTPDHLRPFPTRTDTARRQGKQAAEHTAPCCRKHRLDEEVVTALKVVAGEQAARRASSPCEGDQAVGLTLLPLLQTHQGRPSQLTTAPLHGRRKRACRSEGRRPACVALRFWLSMRLLSMKDEAADRFMGDSILICHLTKRFVVLHHTMDDHRPVFRGKTVFGVFWSWPPFANHRRRAGVRCFVVSKQVLHLEIQVAGGSKEERENW